MHIDMRENMAMVVWIKEEPYFGPIRKAIKSGRSKSGSRGRNRRGRGARAIRRRIGQSGQRRRDVS